MLFRSMRLSVACNLIPKGVRMISRGWIFSHRCSWITVYVSCCNAQMNIVVVIMSCIALRCNLYLSNARCNSFPQHVIYLLWRDTTSELWTPVLSFTLLIQPTANSVLFYCNHCSHFIHCKQTSFSTLYD